MSNDPQFSDNVPNDIRKAVNRIRGAYSIGNGLSDPMYMANIIALEMDRGDGKGEFWAARS